MYSFRLRFLIVCALILQSPSYAINLGELCRRALGRVAEPVEDKTAVDTRWFQSIESTERLKIPKGRSIPEMFLEQAKANPNKPILADEKNGVLTYRDVLTRVLLLKPHLEKLKGERVGVIMPASASTTVVYLATLFAGKTPVMLNFKGGERNIQHAVESLGIDTVITAKDVVTQLDAKEDTKKTLDVVRDKLFDLQELRNQVSSVDKLKAAAKARFSWKDLREAQVPETAAILFTSGSESLPKAVPISQKMLLTNLRDIADVVEINEGDRQISFLPPFHSFGLSLGLAMPLAGGIPTVYTPDPMAFQAVGKTIGDYKTSIVAGTPTFLAGIARRVPKEELSSLRLAVAGAEALTQPVVDFIHKKAPNLTILEGYGKTEAAPVISVNTPTHNKLGTIGRVLPSVDYLIADPDTKVPVAPGKTGKLFVRGPSLFDGYIQHTGSAPFTEIEGKKYHDTGDLVSQDADGHLVFQGRLSRFIKPGGEMVSLGAIEAALEKHFPRTATAPSIAIDATADEKVVLFVTKSTDLQTVNKYLTDAGLTNLSRVKQIVEVPEIKLLATGKTDYQSLKALIPCEAK